MHSWDNMSIFFKDSKFEYPPPPPPPPPRTTNTSGLLSHGNATPNTKPLSIDSTESEELQCLVHASPFCHNKLSKQLSMGELNRDVAWEKRRRKKIKQGKRNKSLALDAEHLIDEDLHELKGSIELGFGFKEEAGQKLCNTLPALDLYFAVNRQLPPSPGPTPHNQGSNCSMSRRTSSLGSPKSEDSWKILGPGDNPQQVKTKLRHWAQAVACSVIQST